MKIVFTKHAFRKRGILKELGWDISLDLVEETVNEPDFKGKTNQGQLMALKYLDGKHNLRVAYKVKDDIITVITFHIARKGRYEK